MTENHISGYFYNELFSGSNEEKCTAFQSMAWSLIVHKNTIKKLSKYFLPYLSSILYFFFLKGKDTCAIPQPSCPYN